jgi:hypothetical protein
LALERDLAALTDAVASYQQARRSRLTDGKP